MISKEPVKLPFHVALDVVMQGIRIRLGRSLVTITGVVCGIAFLMSTLTSQLCKNAVKKEEVLRIESKRMLNFLKADVPSLQGIKIALITIGSISEQENRLLEELQLEYQVKYYYRDERPETLSPSIRILDKQAANLDLFLVIGHGRQLNSSSKSFFGKKMVAFTRDIDKGTSLSEEQSIYLFSKESIEEEKERLKEAKLSKYRNIWIGLISLLVTVIGITNAMLMSVTERFREIGTMKCLGAQSLFIRQIFLLESSIMGLSGGVIGVILGILFSVIGYSFSYGFSIVFGSLAYGDLFLYSVLSIFAGLFLSVMAALYPSSVASKMVPAHALRSNV